MAAIRVMLANVRWIWDEKIEDGKTVLRRVMQFVGGGGVAVADEPIEFQPEVPLVDPRWQALRDLAANMVNASDGPEHYSKVSQTDALWLALLTRTQLCRVATASDDTLEGHMRQKRMMPGIVAADRESILARQMANERDELLDEETLALSARTDELLEACGYGAPKSPTFA